MLVFFQWIIPAIGVYLAVGVLFAIAFVSAGVGRVSPEARGTGWAFRLLIAPGSAVMWPFLAWLWYRPVIPLSGVDDPILDETHTDPEAETKA